MTRDDEIAWLRAQQIALAEQYAVSPRDGLELGICDLFAEELILEDLASRVDTHQNTAHLGDHSREG